VVGRLVLQDPDGEDVPLLRHDVGSDDGVGRHLGVPGRAGDPVDPDAGGDHHQRPGSPARPWSSAGIAAMRANPLASSPVQSRFSSPYVATRGSISENGLRAPTTSDRPAARRVRVSPVTRRCVLATKASMSRSAGSKYWPSWSRSP